jgi:hypothetical protein
VYANAFYQLGAGREMLNSQGYDFTGIWPSIKALAGQLKPASMKASQLASFLNHAFVSVKGGSYDWSICSSGSACERAWAAWGFYVQLPSCSGATMHHSSYVGGVFVNGSTTAASANPLAFQVITPAAMQLLTTPVRTALASWHACAPRALPKLKLSGVSSVVSYTPDLSKLAGIVDSDPNDLPADMQATVSWGDGTPTSHATVVPTAGKGHFNVVGWHEYAASGTHTITVSVKSEATGATVTVHSKLTVV